jgi:hypothetical protein
MIKSALKVARRFASVQSTGYFLHGNAEFV